MASHRAECTVNVSKILTIFFSAQFRIQIIETRLNRHKQSAPRAYAELEIKLKNDPRLRVF